MRCDTPALPELSNTTDYRVNEFGLLLAHSNVRNHTMVINKAVRANPVAEDVTQIFTPLQIDAMLIGKRKHANTEKQMLRLSFDTES